MNAYYDEIHLILKSIYVLLDFSSYFLHKTKLNYFLKRLKTLYLTYDLI